jgi:type IV pilus assembly protein PilM
MAKGSVGLDVGSTAVRAAEVALGGGQPSLVRAAQVPLAVGAVENGEVREPQVVTEAIRELWQRGGFKTRQATLGVGNQRAVVREVTVPALPPKELSQALPFQIQELIPIPLEDAVLDHDVLDEFDQEGTRMLRLLVVAAQRTMVTTMVDAATQAKVEPVGVDLVPFALIRSVGQGDGLNLDESGMGGEAIVDVGADVTNMCVHERGVARFVRILPSGGRDVTRALADALSVSEEEAESLKWGQPVEGAPSPAEVQSIVDRRAGVLVDEIRSSLDFYRAQMPDSEVSRVLVTGGGSKLPGFVERLRDRMGGRVERGHPFGRVAVQLQMDAETMAEAEPLLAVAVGLALPQE